MIERATQRLQDLLESEESVSEVSKFAAWKRDTGFRTGVYEKLVALDNLKEGQQLAFEVDLDLCSGCKACVTGCHSMNGLERSEAWRAVGTLTLEKLFDENTSAPSTVTLPVTTACHHCADPGCANGCPVLAYEKDPRTGIVSHLDDQCIGCQYCILMCPYEVPQYSKRLGIVRKCDLCANRLNEGEAPACVQSCPNEAIKVTVVDTKQIDSRYREARSTASDNEFLPDTPPPHLTVPTTQFKSRHFDELGTSWRSAEREQPRPEPAHTPLAWMLPLSQAAAGCACASLALTDHAQWATRAAGLGLMLAGLLWSIRHLGQPTRAWRAFLGWRRSWLSREMLAFGAFTGAFVGLVIADWTSDTNGMLQTALSWGVGALGLVSVFTSVMIYAVTGRVAWKFPTTATRFFGTTLLLGAASGVTALSLFAPASQTSVWLGLTVASAVAKLAWEAHWKARAKASEFEILRASAQLLERPLKNALKRRLLATVLGLAGISMGTLLHLPLFTVLGLMGLILGEHMERRLFFRSVVPFRMPRSLQ